MNDESEKLLEALRKTNVKGDYSRFLRALMKNLKNSEENLIEENRIRTLIKFGRIDEAIDYYHGQHDLESIDELKAWVRKNDPEATSKLGDYWMEWINMIKYKHDVRVCPYCGGKLLPILWGLPAEHQMDRAQKGEFILGGCMIVTAYEFQCTDCHNKLFIGYKGLDIECGDESLKEYIIFEIEWLLMSLFGFSEMAEKSFAELEGELGLCSDELRAFLNHLEKLNYIEKTPEGRYRMVDLII